MIKIKTGALGTIKALFCSKKRRNIIRNVIEQKRNLGTFVDSITILSNKRGTKNKKRKRPKYFPFFK